MTNATESHAATTPGVWPPPATPAADVVGMDYGTMNRELLAEKLASAWTGNRVNWYALRSDLRADWLRVVDVALSELQGTSS